MRKKMKYLKSYAEFLNDDIHNNERNGDLEAIPIKVCIDKPKSTVHAHARMWNSISHNQLNQPHDLPSDKQNVLTSFMNNPEKEFSVKDASLLTEMAIFTDSKWARGTTITISFLNGSEIQKEKTKKYAEYWLRHANLKFEWENENNTMIRISFQHDAGSWSHIGTDCLNIPIGEPTMNFGWLYDDTQDTEWERVVVHEFGHALGCIHEQASPVADIDWNKDAVYSYYQGPPNNWKREEIDFNIFQKYAAQKTQYTNFDPTSIMEYPIPAQFLKSGHSIGMNIHLSQTDIDFIKKTYFFD